MKHVIDPPGAAPELYKVYTGEITRVMNFGAFVQLLMFNKDRSGGGGSGSSISSEGLVHVSHLRKGVRVTDAKEAVRRGQKVLVKVISRVGNKLGLSIKEVDQTTGRDLYPERGQEDKPAAGAGAGAGAAAAASSSSNPSAPKAAGGYRGKAAAAAGGKRKRARLPSPEMWEASKLIASGVLAVEQYPTYDKDQGG